MNPTGKTLRLTAWHLGLWLGLAAVTASIALPACLRYNEAAGTDKSPGHIAAITAAVLTGPLVGPVANPNPASPFKVPLSLIATTLGLLGLQGVSLVPFLFLKREVSTTAFAAAWAGFIAAAGVWFSAALVSLGFHLS